MWSGGGYDYEAYKKAQAAKAQKDRDEQAVIDSIADPTERKLANRKRYACGTKFVALEALPRWSDWAAKLSGLPNNSTVTKFAAPPKWGGYGGGSLFGQAPTPVAEPDVITAKDLVPRFPVNLAINAKVCVYRGDITTLELDAIVNAANGSMLGGGGIDGAIHGAAGDLLREECERLPILRGVEAPSTGFGGSKGSSYGGTYGERCATGDTKITRGYCLPAKFVLHTVGPIGSGDEELTSCYATVFKRMEENNLRSVALCCVSTGIFDFPLVRATHIALSTARQWLEKHHEEIDLVVFCTFMEHEMGVYEKLLPTYFPTPELPAGKK